MSKAKTRIMYIEDKSENLNGPARIGRVTFSKSDNRSTIGSEHSNPLMGADLRRIISALRRAINSGYPGRARTERIVCTEAQSP